MNDLEIRATLARFLQQARDGDLADGVLYLPAGDPTLATECLFHIYSPDHDPMRSADQAQAQGFPQEGLNTHDLQATMESAKHLAPTPTDAQYLRAFEYYWRFDAWLPELNAEDPPTGDEARLRDDQAFLQSLGQERAEVPCRREGCHRGAVSHSVLCARHHFESLRGRPPFEGGARTGS
jgi:hypothetical protein